MQLRYKRGVRFQIFSFDCQREDAVAPRRTHIHWSRADLSNKVAHHQQIDSLLFRGALVDRQILQMNVAIVVLEKRDLLSTDGYLLPFLQWQIQMILIQ
jgi:hypothetical protein